MTFWTLEEWEAFDRTFPAPTFFARPAFARALSDTFSHLEPGPIVAQHRGARYIVPAVRTRRKPRTVDAFPFGGYSCVLDSLGRTADAATASAVLRSVASRTPAFSFVSWPLAEQPQPSGFESTEYETAAIDCSGGLEPALAGMRGVTRRMVGQAIRRGVTCERRPMDDAGLDTYYAMLHEASIGWGLEAPTIPRSLFDAVARRGGEDVELWFALLDGEPIGGGVILFGRDELFFWSAAMNREFSRFRPSNALNARLIERACERGVRWYNLGASEGLTGVERFKTDLGAMSVPYRRVTARTRVFDAYLALRNVLKTRHAS
ncbi:MAG: GNAT family N-acetyltransferase [Candidatus Eremiobacteraeota bacterium]|nr:GNAT family N-acetyltransferase [Candidatus Eremiobacteraeota bacterium]